MFPFVVTLASQLVIRGLGYVVSGGYSFALANPDFTQIGLGKLFKSIPYPILILLGIAILAYLVLHWTRFGRYVYSVGGNIGAAKASGVNVFWTQDLDVHHQRLLRGRRGHHHDGAHQRGAAQHRRRL